MQMLSTNAVLDTLNEDVIPVLVSNFLSFVKLLMTSSVFVILVRNLIEMLSCLAAAAAAAAVREGGHTRSAWLK